MGLLGVEVRFTPTCVGTARRSGEGWPSAAVHPHVRGDGSGVSGGSSSAAGSPPRAWGRRLLVARKRCGGTVHPHVRGDGSGAVREVSRPNRFTPTCVGTAYRIVNYNLKNDRFTPTCVGTARASAASARAFSGSPPRAWGRLCPASRCCVAFAVHPHVRGDGSAISLSPTNVSGSPPRAWGRRRRCSRPRPPWPVHPHVRGDGLIGDVRVGEARRFTPTCVGTAGRRCRGTP